MSNLIIYGDYLLLGRLAQGGMAEIFLAQPQDRTLAKRYPLVAIKRVRSSLHATPELVKMFRDETNIASTIHHPNICSILDHGEIEGQLYIAMEFIHGKDLKVISLQSKKSNLPPQPYLIATVIQQIAEALHAAHQAVDHHGKHQEIVHRDVTPHNILLSYDGHAKLIDFGVAKAKTRATKTQSGVVKGKYSYMSPEQAIGGNIDARSDLFSLGIVLYELLTGEKPFQGDSTLAMLKNLVACNFSAAETLHPEIPLSLRPILAKAMQRNVDDRYQSGADMARALGKALSSQQIGPSLLATFVKDLFRGDYIAECARLKRFTHMTEVKSETSKNKISTDTNKSTTDKINATATISDTNRPVLNLDATLVAPSGAALSGIDHPDTHIATEGFHPEDTHTKKILRDISRSLDRQQIPHLIAPKQSTPRDNAANAAANTTVDDVTDGATVTISPADLKKTIAEYRRETTQGAKRRPTAPVLLQKKSSRKSKQDTQPPTQVLSPAEINLPDPSMASSSHRVKTKQQATDVGSKEWAERRRRSRTHAKKVTHTRNKSDQGQKNNLRQERAWLAIACSIGVFSITGSYLLGLYLSY